PLHGVELGDVVWLGGHAHSVNHTATYCYLLIDSAACCYLLVTASVQLSSVHHMEIPPDVYAWKAVADEIKRRIADGRYQPRMPIPAERRLAEELGVAVGTVRRAVARLRDEGVLVTLPQKGTFVAATDDSQQ